MAGSADCFGLYLWTWLLPAKAHRRLPICSHGRLLGRHAPRVALLWHHACSTAVNDAHVAGAGPSGA